MTKVVAILVGAAMAGLFLVGLFKRVRYRGRPPKPAPSLRRVLQPEEQFFLKILAGICFFTMLALWNFGG